MKTTTIIFLNAGWLIYCGIMIVMCLIWIPFHDLIFGGNK